LLILFATLGLEILVAVALGYKNKLFLLSVVLVNLMTNPLLNYVLWVNTAGHFLKIKIINLFLLEILVVLAEWFLLAFIWQKKIKKLLFLSLLMNLISAGTGIIFGVK